MIVRAYSNNFGDYASVEASVNTDEKKIKIIHRRGFGDGGGSTTVVFKPQHFGRALCSFDSFVDYCEKKHTVEDIEKKFFIEHI